MAIAACNYHCQRSFSFYIPENVLSSIKVMILNKTTPYLLLAAFLAGNLRAAETTTITVQMDQPGPRINPAMWGIFFEDINLGADGGLYAELVKNRGFEFPDPLMGWSKLPSAGTAGKLEVLEENPFNQAGPHYLRLTSTGSSGLRYFQRGLSGNGHQGRGDVPFFRTDSFGGGRA